MFSVVTTTQTRSRAIESEGMQSDTLLTGKQRNDWTRSRQALLTLRAYGELVTQFPTNYASQLDKIKEFYDALVNEERPPHGCTKAMLLCPWRSAQPTEMKGQEIMNRALATRLEVRDVIVPAAMKVMVGGKCPSGKSEEETLGLILDILWRAAEEKRVAEAEKRVKRQTNKENEQETEVEETNKRPGSAGGIRPIKAGHPTAGLPARRLGGLHGPIPPLESGSEAGGV